MGRMSELLQRPKVFDGPPEPGFLTAKQWAKEEGCDPMTIRRMINQLTEMGKVESRLYRIVRDAGHPYPTVHYRLIDVPVSRKAKGKAK